MTNDIIARMEQDVIVHTDFLFHCKKCNEANFIFTAHEKLCRKCYTKKWMKKMLAWVEQMIEDYPEDDGGITIHYIKEKLAKVKEALG